MPTGRHRGPTESRASATFDSVAPDRSRRSEPCRAGMSTSREHRLDHWTDQPPSEGRMAPLMFTPSSESRKVIGGGHGRDGLPEGGEAGGAGLGMWGGKGDSGTAFTRMPWGPYLNAVER